MDMKRLSWAAGIGLIILLAGIAGCGPRPPVRYQQLQIQDSEESRGFDIYLYVAVRPGTTEEQVEALLKWFDTVKYPSVKTMKVFVWTNPQSALINATGDLAGSLYVDREKGIYELNVGHGPR